jgi:hypothetical protein
LAALRRWQSFPAAREADFIATGGGKRRPLDNAKIERICKRMTKMEKKRDAAIVPRQLNNGASEGKRPRLRDGMRTAQDRSEHQSTRVHSLLQQQRISSSVALDG